MSQPHKLSKRPSKAKMLHALKIGAGECFTEASWSGVLFGLPHGYDAYRRFMLPLAPATDDFRRDPTCNGYTTEHERCMWLCMAIGALTTGFPLPEWQPHQTGGSK